MQDLRQKVTGGVDLQGKLKGLASAIPGFGGYQAKDSRRDADKLLRLHIARQLDEQRTHLREITGKLGAGKMEAVGSLSKSITKLQTLMDKIKTASYGSGSLFDAVRVKEEQLDALYTYDNSMLQGILPLATAVTALETAVKSKQGLEDALEGVASAVDQLSTAWTQRQDVILRS
jgi:exonuclease VII small subunit